ncbi:hypothetical protein Barb6_01913 [Bacteroidales bacterium Barb6]|nr:hypothetical protein Barb6_01913 [Bacteroidales bacterium Barb6]
MFIFVAYLSPISFYTRQKLLYEREVEMVVRFQPHMEQSGMWG